MTCKHHPDYDPASGEPENEHYDTPLGFYHNADCMDCNADCMDCWQARAKYITDYLNEQSEEVRTLQERIEELEGDKAALEKKLTDVQDTNRILLEGIDRGIERHRELEQRVLDEQSAFDKIEELYLREQEGIRVLERQMADLKRYAEPHSMVALKAKLIECERELAIEKSRLDWYIENSPVLSQCSDTGVWFLTMKGKMFEGVTERQAIDTARGMFDDNRSTEGGS